MHVQISIVHQGYIRWELAAWLAWLVQNERRRAFSITWYDGRTYGGRPVDSNRNRIVRDRPAGADLLMIDADTIPSNPLFDLCVAGMDVVLAPVPIYRPDSPDGPAILNIVPKQGGEMYQDQFGQVYQEILEGGSGVLYISNAVLEALGPAPFRFAFDKDGVVVRGEDHEFCRKAREAGFSIYAALDLLCGHGVEVNLKTIADAIPSTDASTRRFQVIVTGTGRSGTGFAAQWLSSAGVPCGHEQFFTFTGWDGAQSRMRRRPELVAESSWLAAPWLDKPQLADALVIHQVRHPKKVAESCMRHPPGTTPEFLQYLEHHCPTVAKYPDDLNKAIARWVYWNWAIEDACQDRAYYRWKVEDGEEKLLAWLQEQGVVGEVDPEHLYSNRSYNPHRHEVQAEARLEDVAPELRKPLLETMRRYGYAWSET